MGMSVRNVQLSSLFVHLYISTVIKNNLKSRLGLCRNCSKVFITSVRQASH